MKESIRLIGAILVGASLVGTASPTHMTSATEITDRINIKIQGGLESMVKSGNYPRYKNSS